MSMEEVAAAMAMQGTRTEDTPLEYTPEESIPAAAEPSGSPETGTPAPETAPAATEQPLVSSTEAAPAQQQPAATPADWREELKKADTTEVLKLLGFDDKITGFVNTWKGGGDISKYLQAANVDYGKMSSEDILRQSLREEFADLSDEDFQVVYDNKINEGYKQDPDLFNESQRRVGKVLMDADAKKLRAGMISKQQEFILNSKPPAPTGPTPEQQAQQAQQTRNWYRSEVLKYPAAAAVEKNKEFTIGDGTDAFHFKVDDPGEIFDIITDSQKMIAQVFDPRTENGQQALYPNGEKNLLIGLVAKYGMSLFDAYGKHMKALGAAGALEPIENASRSDGKPTSSAEPELTPAQALARQGQFTR
jgi:hypothetical protein